MKILLVKSMIPAMKRAGTDVVTRNLLELLSMDHTVTFLGMGHSPVEVERVAALKDICAEARAILAPNKRSPFHRLYHKLLNTFRFIALGRSYESSYNAPKAFKRAITEVTGRERFDLVIIEYWHNASLKPWVRRGARAVLLIHDAAFVNNHRRLCVERNIWKKAILRPYFWLKKQEELQSIAKFDQVLALSSADVEHVRAADPRMGKIGFRTIPISMRGKADEIIRDNDIVGRERSLYFMGSLERFNHMDAVTFFLDEIHPELERSSVDTRFFVVGRCRPHVQKRLKRIGPVEFVGFVEDPVSDLKPYGICVVPLRVGSGIKIKILEAFILGKPVVTTSVGAEGIDFFNQYPDCVRDDPREFAGEIERLLEDRNYFDQVREAQWKYAENNLTIQGNRETFKEAIEFSTGDS